MNRKLSISQKGFTNVLAVALGVGLLAVLAFSLNALFASRTQQQPQVAREPRVERQPTSSQAMISLTPLPTPKNTEEWKETSLGKIGFTFKYPPDWIEEPLKDTKGWLYRPKNESRDSYLVTYLLDPSVTPVDDLETQAVERLTKPEGSFEIIKKQWVLVTGRPSFWITYRRGNSVYSEIHVPNLPNIPWERNITWVFNTHHEGPSAQNLIADPYEDTLKLILSTFQVAPSTE